MEEKIDVQHKVTLVDREMLEITGVLNVEKFTDDDVILETQQGFLNIKGEKMHMKQLDLEGKFIAVEGIIKSMDYLERTETRDKAKNILSKIFK